ncbi:MAG TPA: DALR domain-containing protein, partial [Trebonia sp.]
KSAGHAAAAADALRRVRPQELRYYLGQAHYRSTIEYTPEALDDAAAAYRRIERFVIRAQAALGSAAPADAVSRAGDVPRADEAEAEPDDAPFADETGLARLPLSFSAALDDDLNVSAALAALHATVRDGNYALGAGDTESAATCLAQARAMLEVLGLDPLGPAWQGGDPGDRLRDVVGALVALALRQREAARARCDYASADSIRDTLERNGVLVEDTPEGPRWELAR